MPAPILVDTPDPGAFVGVDLLAYQPEQSTAVVIPTTVVNIAAGTLGPWANPSNATGAGAGASITASGVGNSNFLQCAPAPAGTYSGIDDGADITKMVVAFEVFVVRLGIYFSPSYLVLMGSNAQYGAGQQVTTGIEGGWQLQSFTMDKAFYFPGGITGSQWKNGNFGPGFQVKNDDVNQNGSTQIRAVTMRVFFQNPVPAGGAQLLCEA